jgi:hypothetical protein
MCNFSTGPSDPTSLSLTAPNGINRSDPTPPNTGQLYNNPAPAPHTVPDLGFPRPIRATASLICTLAIGFPQPAADLEFPLVAVEVYVGIIDVVLIRAAFTDDL